MYGRLGTTGITTWYQSFSWQILVLAHMYNRSIEKLDSQLVGKVLCDLNYYFVCICVMISVFFISDEMHAEMYSRKLD